MAKTAEQEARAAMAQVADLQKRLDAARERRDRAIVRMTEDGRQAPDVARTLGVSVAHVRLTLRVEKARRSGTPAAAET